MWAWCYGFAVGTEGVVVGRVIEVRPHPDGEHIWLADVNVGTDWPLQIIWGGMPIVKKGSLVPVAKPGAWLPATKDKPNRYKLRTRRYRGVRSEGMLCSLAELGWDPSATDRVALLEGSDLSPGYSLDDIGPDWKLIVKPAVDLFGTRDSAAFQSPKVLQTT